MLSAAPFPENSLSSKSATALKAFLRLTIWLLNSLYSFARLSASDSSVFGFQYFHIHILLFKWINKILPWGNEETDEM